jgi:hypothetical protein
MPIGYVAAVLLLASGAQPATTAADAIARRFNVQVIVESGLSVPATSESAAKAATIEKALDALVTSIPGSAWRRVHVQVAAGKPMPAAGTLADRVRTLEKQAGTNLVIEKPNEGRGMVLMSNYAVTPAYRNDLTRAQYRSVYLVFSLKPPREASTKVAAETPPPADQSVVVDVFGDMLGTFFSLDQASQQQGMQQAMTLLSTLDPGARAEFVTTMWRSMSPELQADVVRSVMRFEQARQRRP